MDRLKKCNGCGQQLPEYVGMGQPRKFCSDDCRSEARNRTRRAGRVKISTEQRFFSKTKEMPSGCVEWTAAKNGSGYGNFRLGDKTLLAHRFAYELATGVSLKSQQVLHTCDNPPCVNPAHLFLGTHDENMADRDAKGRTLQGVQARHKFDLAAIERVRQLLADGLSHRQIKNLTGVSMSHISGIRNGTTRRNG